MPPPRLSRPLRPCRPPWSLPRPQEPIRRASNYRHHDGASRESLPTEEPPPTSAGFWSSYLGRAASLFSRQPAPAPVPTPEPSSPQQTPLVQPLVHPPIHVSESPRSSVPTSIEPACPVCQGSVPAGTDLRSHVLKQSHLPCWSAVFESHLEAKLAREQWLNDTEFRKAAKQKKDNGTKRICRSCNTQFPSAYSLTNHLLLKDSCWPAQIRKPHAFFCWNCKAIFTSRAQACQHIASSPACADRFTMKIVQTGSNLEQLFPQLVLYRYSAERQYYRSVTSFIESVAPLRAMSSPIVMPLADRAHRFLAAIEREAFSTQDSRLLQLLDKVSQQFAPLPRDSIHPSKGNQVQSSLESASDIQQNAPSVNIRYYHTTRHNFMLTNPESGTQSSQGMALQPQETGVAVVTDAHRETTSRPQKAKEPVVTDTFTEMKLQLQQLVDQVKVLNEKLLQTEHSASDAPAAPPPDYSDANITVPSDSFAILKALSEKQSDNHRLIRSPRTQSKVPSFGNSRSALIPQEIIDTSLPTSEDPLEPTSASRQPPLNQGETKKQSLLEELFPETTTYTQHHTGRNPYPKLHLPDSTPLIRRFDMEPQKTERERFIESFQDQSDRITVLQLVHCSTELTEADFRRLIPKGKHIESWARDGEFYKVIPGRDPLTLERLPFYYLLFKSSEAALQYQNNAVRLHKLSQLHHRNNVFSVIPPPRGFLEDGEDINAATSAYLLAPPDQQLSLHMVMQPYNPYLRQLFEEGGYQPIVPSTTPEGKPIYRVLLHVEGYEPSPTDLFQCFLKDNLDRGITWEFFSSEHTSIHRLRDIINLKAKLLPVSSVNPRSANTSSTSERRKIEEYDPSLNFLGLMQSDLELSQNENKNDEAQHINQMVMNRLYNRWLVDFKDEDGARRFARVWNRKELPFNKSKATWKDYEEARICNTEFLW